MDRLHAIFEKQKELMEKYHHIELASGLLQTTDCPVDLNDKNGQARIKDMAWRFMEEVGEALHAISEVNHTTAEEFIDGLHFLVELTILSGRGHSDIVSLPPHHWEEGSDYLGLFYQEGRLRVYDIAGSHGRIGPHVLDCLVKQLVRELGMMCNTLKNKPWKQTYKETDTTTYFKRLESVWMIYFGILSLGMTTNEIACKYLDKALINQERQRSKY